MPRLAVVGALNQASQAFNSFAQLCKLTWKIGVPPLKICHPSVANPELPLSESPVRPTSRKPKRLIEIDPPI